MRLASLFCLCCALPCLSQGAECDSAAQVIEAHGHVLIRNVSDKSIVAYVITKTSSTSQVRKRIGAYTGTFTDGDSLGPGQSLEVGKADVAVNELTVGYVRFADGWKCGEDTPDALSPR